MKRQWSLLVVFFCFPPLLAQAQDDEDERNRTYDYLHPGLVELRIDAGVAWTDLDDTGFDTRTINASGAIGLFLTEWLEIGAMAEYFNQKLELQATTTRAQSVLVAPQLTLNLPVDSPVVPFLTGAAGAAYGKFEANNVTLAEELGWFWQAGGGLRIFASRRAAINATVVYQHIIFDDDLNDLKNILFTLGLSIFF
jgi:hypothetical protein